MALSRGLRSAAQPGHLRRPARPPPAPGGPRRVPGPLRLQELMHSDPRPRAGEGSRNVWFTTSDQDHQTRAVPNLGPKGSGANQLAVRMTRNRRMDWAVGSDYELPRNPP